MQRNGRIDRLGQRHPPELRYLLVDTSEGLLSGDGELFDRLIAKVEEINRLRQSGESVLQLYDEQAETEYIARQGLLASNPRVLDGPTTATDTESGELEAMLNLASQDGHDEFLSFLLGNGGAAKPTDTADERRSAGRLRLFDDTDFLREGYCYLRQHHPDHPELEQHGAMLGLTPPADLRRRLGASERAGDVIFGATAIPLEAWPENHQFRLSADPACVEQAITAARNRSGYWANELLLNEQHPILQWLTERLLMQIPRGQAPLVISPHLEAGEFCFCFVGQHSSRAGAPLVTDAHAISFGRDGRHRQRPLREALAEARLDQLANTGVRVNLQAAQLLLHAAVDASLAHLRRLMQQRVEDIRPLLESEERRLRQWRNRRRTLLERRIAELGAAHPQARRHGRQLDEMERYLDDRQRHWRDVHLVAAAEPATRLVLVIAGPADGQD